MAEEETIFDPTLKKKKKKKKTPFNMESFQDGGGADGGEDAAEAGDETAGKENVDEDMSLDFSGLKKKKTKKKPFNLEDVENALPESQSGADKEENVGERDAEEGVKDTAADDDFDFNLPTKKKRKKKINLEDLSGANADDDDMFADVEKDKSGVRTWTQDNESNYKYEELLTRVFDIMREKNPDMVAGEKRRFVMKPPQVVRVGTKKTSFVNFTDICKMLHRQPKHLLAFLLAELGTSGSVDGMNQLIIKGRFQQKQIENVLRRYIKEYVTCHTCHSANTILQKDTRLFFLQCESCGSRCSVASIKSGFQAVTSKRAAIRAKTN